MRGKDKHATIVGEADGSEVIGKKTDSISPHYELSPMFRMRWDTKVEAIGIEGKRVLSLRGW